jgi:hypothetical protein
MKTTLKLKINPIQKCLGLIIYPIKPSAGHFFLIKSGDTILLSYDFITTFVDYNKYETLSVIRL